MIEVKITPEILEEAKARNSDYYNRFGNAGTHRTDKSRQRMTGYLAEACIRSEYPYIKYSEDYHVDFVFDSITIDSKAQGCNGKPKGYYSATLYEDQKDRNTDYYIFSRIKNDYSTAWIGGIVSKKRFLKIASFRKAGHQTNNFTYDQSRYEVKYDDLKSIKDFLEWHNSKKKLGIK